MSLAENSDKNSNIAHRGLNFWRKFVAESPTCNFESDNCFLFLLDDDGHLLDCLRFVEEKQSCSDVMKICRALKWFYQATSLVRLQTQSAYKKDPLARHSSQTEALYTLAEYYNIHLEDVIVPRFTK